MPNTAESCPLDNYSSIKPSKQEVLDFLRHNTEILDEYVNNEVSKETIIQWMTSAAAGSGNNVTEKGQLIVTDNSGYINNNHLSI